MVLLDKFVGTSSSSFVVLREYCLSLISLNHKQLNIQGVFCFMSANHFALHRQNIAKFKVDDSYIRLIALDFKGVRYTEMSLYFYNFLGLKNTQSGQRRLMRSK